ncbi:MAG: aconitate hydratase [Solirubrobacterales bacterium]
MSENSFDSEATLEVGDRSYEIHRIDALQEKYDVARLPYCLKVLLENVLRLEDGHNVTAEHVEAVAAWDANAEPDDEIPFQPARVLMQDFTGVPAVVDLAAMRDAMDELGGDPSEINPLVPVDLVIDHSVQVDAFGNAQAFEINAEREFERNRERYEFLKWGKEAFANFSVVPPATGICHQVNLEYLGQVVYSKETDGNGTVRAYPDSLVGTDSHTPMINGLGVLGWGVGGIEAEAALLGQPISMLVPQVVGVRLHGELPEGSTATDLVLRVTEMLREHGVVGKFVEFYGEGIASMSVPDRATLGNMSPEFGCTVSITPPDSETLRYLEFTNRPSEVIELVEAYCKEQGMFHDDDYEEPTFSSTLELDLGDIRPAIAGPKLPQQRIALEDGKERFYDALSEYNGDAREHLSKADEAVVESFPASDPPGNTSEGVRQEGEQEAEDASVAVASEKEMSEDGIKVTLDGTEFELDHGRVVIAAITSCTNTSNPSVMMAAGLVAKKARERGLERQPWVKTSLAPGSTVVTDYLERSGLIEPLRELDFDLVGYGCTTCIGNSGPLPEPISDAINEKDLVVCSVLSGNRNFEGRISQDVRANYLASPPLVVAYALAGRMDIDLTSDPLGTDSDGEPVFLADIWPSSEEIKEAVDGAIEQEMYTENYASVFEGDERWNEVDVPREDRYTWPPSTYVRQPPFFQDMDREPADPEPVTDARVLALLGDSVTTDHISPAGAIKKKSPAGEWLLDHDVDVREFNSYGSRRGNHEVMMRGTFANIRIRNLLVDREGGFTKHFPSGEEMPIYDAAMRYIEDDTDLVVLGGVEYGSGSSRDWAAKGTLLLGVKAVIAEGYERIHRSNLIGMGVLPLQFSEGERVEELGLTGEERISIAKLEEGAKTISVTAEREGEDPISFDCDVRLDTPTEREYYRHGGILHKVIRDLL